MSDAPAKKADRSARSVVEFSSDSRSISLPYSAMAQDWRVDEEDFVAAEMTDSLSDESAIDMPYQMWMKTPP